MSQHREFRLSPVEGLPLELVRMVLSALSDVASLQAAVLSCPLFYHPFLEAETAITTPVLLNQIDANVLPKALATFESSQLRPHDTDPKTWEAVTDFVTRNLRQRPCAPTSWSLLKALRLERLHFHVDRLTKKFVEVALTNPPLNPSTSTATCQERCRIERALFRFELYCNLFRESMGVQPSIYGEQKQLFFANFAPWENEQLGCIHDFLVRAVSPAFNDIAEHDVAWGVFQVEYSNRVDSPFIQEVLSLGLEKLHQIVNAETYEERWRLLNSRECPNATVSFLHDGLQGANERNDNIFLDDMTPEDEVVHIKQPFFADQDSGPADVWRWAHQEESWANWVYQENRRGLRQWGYVMWDRSRLNAVGIFQDPWEDTDGSEESLLEEQEAARERAYMQNSWEKREEIFMRGGTGWWSWGDESKVRWRGGKAPIQGPSVPARGVPVSLQDARDILSMIKLPPSLR
ncbi:hypothetical protein F4677DRAFT_436620 [Hypoxylon crocopeplum]|nr:hypothetical protein F4677DRAFT_436620 [Hypoxylon crocopeplum]